MAKPKKPSMTARQRQLRAQQQQVRQASQNKLPPSGGTSGGKGGAMTKSPGGRLTSQRSPEPKTQDANTNQPKRLGQGSSTSPKALPGGRPGGALAIRASRPGATAAVAQLGSAAVNEAAKRITNAYGRAINRERSERAAESGQRGRYSPGENQVQFNKPKPADKKPATPPVKATAQRTTAMPASRMTPPIPKPKQETKAAAQSYRDPEDVKGLSVGRYRTLSEHLAAVQANKAMKISSKMDTKSDVYTPSTKVDGSKLDTSKVTAKTEEYDKKKGKKLS